MRCSNCFKCGYFKKLKESNGRIRNYCDDRDCTVNPYDPDCNYDD